MNPKAPRTKLEEGRSGIAPVSSSTPARLRLGRRGAERSWRARAARARRRAMTLIEVLIVLALLAVIMGAVVVGTGQMASSKLSHSSTMLAGAIRIGFARATSSSKSVRLVMDFEKNELWLEEGDQPMLTQSRDTSGTGGAAAATMAEKQAMEDTSRIVKGPMPPRTSFTEIEPMGLAASSPGKGHKPLERGIKFREVQTEHDAEPRKEGRAYLYFWPGGQTERAVIQLTAGDKNDEARAITLVVAPLTGKVTVRDGAVPLPAPLDDKEASERQDPGAF